MPDDSNCLDPVTGKPRLMAAQCTTCIGRPGNLMKLSPGRVQGLVNDAIQSGGGIICHQTLSYGGHPEHGGPAYCRWLYDKFGPRINLFRVYRRIGGFTEVEVEDA